MVSTPLSPEPRLDLDLEAEAVGQVLLEGTRVGVLVLATRRGLAPEPPSRSARGSVLHQRLGRAHVELAIDDLVRELHGIVAAHQCAAVTGRELALLDHGAHLGWQLQQAHRVGEMAAALADHVRQLLLRVAEALDQLVVAGRLLDGVEVRRAARSR